MPKGSLALEKRGHLAWLTLSRPEKQNAIDAALVGELAGACEAIEGDEDVRVVVLTAAGDVFCSGWDWGALLGEDAKGETLVESARLQGLLDDPFGCLAELSRPVVCALNGDAAGAGLALALACDVRIAVEGARFCLPETEMGLIPMAGASQRITRLVGRGRALEMVLTGRSVEAREALEMGLVSAIAPRERLRDEAESIAQRIADRGPIAVRYAKEAVQRGIEMPLEQALRYETDLTIILQTTEDRAEGVRAFLEKRKPKFKGR